MTLRLFQLGPASLNLKLFVDLRTTFKRCNSDSKSHQRPLDELLFSPYRSGRVWMHKNLSCIIKRETCYIARLITDKFNNHSCLAICQWVLTKFPNVSIYLKYEDFSVFKQFTKGQVGRKEVRFLGVKHKCRPFKQNCISSLTTKHSISSWMLQN